MSSALPSTITTVAEAEILGVLFIGFIATTILYGLTFFRKFPLATPSLDSSSQSISTETYVYFSRYPNDSQWMKYLVCHLYVLSFIQELICFP